MIYGINFRLFIVDDNNDVTKSVIGTNKGD